jgi:hypothetical protein
MLYSADFIAFRGAWLRLEVDTKTGEIWAKLSEHLNTNSLRSFGVDFSLLNNYSFAFEFNYKSTKALNYC